MSHTPADICNNMVSDILRRCGEQATMMDKEHEELINLRAQVHYNKQVEQTYKEFASQIELMQERMEESLEKLESVQRLLTKQNEEIQQILTNTKKDPLSSYSYCTYIPSVVPSTTGSVNIQKS